MKIESYDKKKKELVILSNAGLIWCYSKVEEEDYLKITSVEQSKREKVMKDLINKKFIVGVKKV